MIPINPEAIGDPDQTPVVYIGEQAGRALGIRDSSPPSPAQRPTGQVDRPAEIWACKIGETFAALPRGADLPMRQAVERAYKEITGEDAVFLFSGWGAELTVSERAAYLDIDPPEPDSYDVPALLADLDAAREALRRVEQERDEAQRECKKATELLVQAWEERDEARAAQIVVQCDDPEHAERDRMRPVVEAARAIVPHWRLQGYRGGSVWASDHAHALVAAVDTYETREGTDR